jgi:hypothetical protein
MTSPSSDALPTLLARVLAWAKSVHTDAPRCDDGDCWLCRDLALLSGSSSSVSSPTQETTLSRDALGRIVREAWVAWAREHPTPKPSWLAPYDDLNEADKEADRRIGEAVAARVSSGSVEARTTEPQKLLPENASDLEKLQDIRGHLIPAIHLMEFYCGPLSSPMQTLGEVLRELADASESIALAPHNNVPETSGQPLFGSPSASPQTEFSPDEPDVIVGIVRKKEGS